jgi:hypothetical protein
MIGKICGFVAVVSALLSTARANNGALLPALSTHAQASQLLTSTL